MTHRGNGFEGRRASDRLVALAVERIGARGDGIAEHEGEPVFLPFTVPGDRVRARLGARRGGGREGWAVEWLDFGRGTPIRRARISAAAAAARYSISIRLPIE